MRITKVKHVLPNGKDEERVEIAWSIAPKEDPEAKFKNWDSFSLDLGVPPLPSFADALQSLAPDIADICELPEDDAQRIKVRSISFTYHHGIMGAIITGIKDLEDSNGIVLLNTPHKPSETGESGGDEANLLDAGTIERLERVIEEARRYVNGERGVREIKQPSLFDGEDEADIVRVLPDLLGELCESCAPELHAVDKFNLVKIEGVPHICTGTDGDATNGWEEARVWRVVKPADFDGETFSFQQLPPGGDLHGHLVSSGRAKWVVTGEEITVRAEEQTPVPADADADADWENAFPVRTNTSDEDESDEDEAE